LASRRRVFPIPKTGVRKDVGFFVNVAVAFRRSFSKLHSSQSRLAKMEAGDSSVSLDLLFRSLFSLGVSRKDLLEELQ